MCNTDGTCPDNDRDWCPRCEQCRTHDGERCGTCGREWGSDD
jgi:hypothetical protein